MKIVLHPILRRKVNCIGIFGRFNPAMKTYIKQYQGVRWSSSQKCFYIVNSGTALSDLNAYLLNENYLVDATAFGRLARVASRPSEE